MLQRKVKEKRSIGEISDRVPKECLTQKITFE